MFTRLENGAEVEMETTTRWELGAETEVDGVYTVKVGAEEEVWFSGYPVGDYTIGDFPSADCSIYVNSGVDYSIGENIRMGFRLYQVGTVGSHRVIGIWIYGNFVNPVISCEATMECNDTKMSGNTTFGFQFYNGDTYKSMRNVVGYFTDSTTRTERLTNHVQSGTFDKIFIRLNVYVESTSLEDGLAIVSIKNLTIDGKRITGKLGIGTEASYD